jgi:KDO2-lipid IV(A) lauroyltransferase
LLRKGKQRRTRSGGLVLGAVSNAFFAIARTLPLGAASNFGGFVGRALGTTLMKDRNIARNLGIAFPNLSVADRDRLMAGIADNLGRVIAEMPHLEAFRNQTHNTRIDIEGLENLPGSGPSVFVGGHLSNWEVGVVALCKHLGGLNTLYTPIGVPAVDQQLQFFRARTGATYLERNRSSLRTIFDDMEAGRSAAMLIDQRVANGPTVNFFGRPALASNLPARLSMRFNVPIVPVDGSRLTPHHFVIRLHKPIRPTDYPDESREQDMTQAMMTAIEEIVCRSPDVWFCNKARWKDKDTATTTPAADGTPNTLAGTMTAKEEF